MDFVCKRPDWHYLGVCATPLRQATDSKQMGVPLKLFMETVSGWISPTGHSLQTPKREYRKVEFGYTGIRCHF